MTCPCIHPDLDPELGEETCACGHVLDEHDATGQCQAEIGELLDGRVRPAMSVIESEWRDGRDR